MPFSSLYYTVCFPLHHNLPTHTTSPTLCTETSWPLTRLERQGTASHLPTTSYTTLRDGARTSIYHLLNLTLHLGKCWILMWDVLSTPARHGPLGLHSGSQKTWGGWYKTTPILRNVLEQPPLLTDCVLLLDGEVVLLVGTVLSHDIFLSPLTEVFTSQWCLMWGKQFPAQRTRFQFNQLMEEELFIPLPRAFHHLHFPAATHSLRQSLYQML